MPKRTEKREGGGRGRGTGNQRKRRRGEGKGGEEMQNPMYFR